MQAAVSLRYLAGSGARVFSTGSHDFAAGLDTLTQPNRYDPRLERFMVKVPVLTVPSLITAT